MKILSPSFNYNEEIPAKHTCDGENINPLLLFSDIPENANSLILIMDDPDSPTGIWLHWSVWNIDPKTNSIKENSVPIGAIEGKTSFGNAGYGGPCPGSGKHRYFFRLYALDIKLNLKIGANRESLEQVMKNHIIEQTELMGVFQRK